VPAHSNALAITRWISVST